MTRTASQIDAHVGQRMRRRREALGISQGRLGRHLGLTFSQVQKYEKGTNRIGAGRLYQIASFLGVSPGYFFAGLDEPEDPGATADDLRRKGETSTLVEAFEAIHDPDRRASILALVMSLSTDPATRGPRG